MIPDIYIVCNWRETNQMRRGRYIIVMVLVLLLTHTIFSGVVAGEDWTQTTQSDFDAGIKNDVDTFSSPGDVILAQKWIKSPSTYVMDLGPPDSWDDHYVWTPRILYDGTTYHMWYSGDESHNGRIGYATSADGIAWTKYSGNPVMDCGPSGSWEESVYVPTIYFDGSTYHMWYTGFHFSTNSYRIGYATSSNGLTWTKYAGNPVLDLGPLGSWDDERVLTCSVLHDGTRFHMWYSGADGPRRRIGHAVSFDGITWTKSASNPVLEEGPSGTWDSSYIFYPTVHYDGTVFNMWYIGVHGSKRQLGYATSPDGDAWTKYPSNPVLDVGVSGTWDDTWISIPCVRYYNSNYHLWYTGYDGSNFRIGHAILGYRPTGTFESSVFDSGALNPYWHFITWKETLPSGTDITMATRTGSTPVPDASWSTWCAEMGDKTGSTITSPNARFIQYRATLSTNDPSVTPYLREVTINYSLNQPPVAEAGEDLISNEGDPILFDGTASYDPDGTIVSFECDFDASDGLWWETGGIPDATGSTSTHTYGDDGVFIVTLRVTDNDNLSATDTCNITVLNVNPTVTVASAIMNVEIGLRVAGRKYNDVGLTLFEDSTPIGYVSIERLPGSPDEQMAWIPLSVDFSKSYSATVTYTPEDPPNIGANPVWIYLKSDNGSIIEIHHTFNVQQSMKRDSDHWNHVEPWEVDLSAHFIGLPFEITSHVTDPGSDDEILTYRYGSQIVNVTFLNNPPNLDPYPSPEVNPVDIMDTTTLVYEGPGTVILVVKDDDNVRLGIGEGTDSITVG
jgi:predicted GH43/DUF377 family glycosyl hydrolase